MSTDNSNQNPRIVKLSPAQRKALSLVHSNDLLKRNGIQERTVNALLKRGLIVDDEETYNGWRLTEAGRKSLTSPPPDTSSSAPEVEATLTATERDLLDRIARKPHGFDGGLYNYLIPEAQEAFDSLVGRKYLALTYSGNFLVTSAGRLALETKSGEER